MEMVTVSVRYRERESPTTSKPGPMLEDVQGTLIVNFLDAIVRKGWG